MLVHLATPYLHNHWFRPVMQKIWLLGAAALAITTWSVVRSGDRASATGATSAADPEDRAALEARITPEVEIRHTKAYLQQLDEHLARERADVPFSSDLQTRLAASLNNAKYAAGSNVRAVDCTPTLCRIDVQISKAERRSDVLNHLMTEVMADMGTAFSWVPDGSDELYWYVARGESLPAMPPIESFIEPSL